jgi:hypothetical protein
VFELVWRINVCRSCSLLLLILTCRVRECLGPKLHSRETPRPRASSDKRFVAWARSRARCYVLEP